MNVLIKCLNNKSLIYTTLTLASMPVTSLMMSPNVLKTGSVWTLPLFETHGEYSSSRAKGDCVNKNYLNNSNNFKAILTSCEKACWRK